MSAVADIADSRVCLIKTELHPRVREELPRASITHPKQVYRAIHELIGMSDAECLGVIHLDGQNRPVGVQVLARGTVTQCVCDPREVFKAALLANAKSIIMFHNHPAGSPAPSVDDYACTARIVEAGKILGVELLDHVIVCPSGAYRSVMGKDRLI